MDDRQPLNIRIKPVVHKPERARLPAKIKRNYSTKLLVTFVTRTAMEALKQYADSDHDYELGGVLLGKTGKSSRRMFIVIRNFIPARKGVSRRASFEFTNEAQQEIHETLESQFKGEQILGWFHTHPGYGIFLSAADQFIDQHYFKEKYHVAMVLDPNKPGVEVGVFVWNQQDQRVRVPFFEVE